MALIDFVATVNAGSKEIVYMAWAAPTGTTNIITGSPTVTIYDSTGAPVAAWSAVGGPLVGFDNSAVAAPRVWVTVDTLSPTVFTPGRYKVAFTFTVTNSGDNIARVEVREGVLNVAAVP